MKFRSCWLIFILIVLSLISCSQPKSSQEIAETVNKSLVLIYYENQGGHGTGFIIPGKKGVCTVLTAGHVVKGYSLKLQTYQDKQSHTTDRIQTSPTYDLAVVTFKSAGESCPYPSVNFGDSNELKVGHKIYISGFPVLQNEDLAPEFLEGSVSRINVVLAEGYGINYTAQLSVGISGAPVLDASGKVVAVHGQAKDKLPRGIPIKTYLANFNTNALTARLAPTQAESGSVWSRWDDGWRSRGLGGGETGVVWVVVEVVALMGWWWWELSIGDRRGAFFDVIMVLFFVWLAFYLELDGAGVVLSAGIGGVICVFGSLFGSVCRWVGALLWRLLTNKK
ncbi:serine protease [Microcoleus sp. MON1_C1]|uniref:serine protease n=1 Tax=Microcoleus sp. MON1_C1 TaxID=2818827 RepID=UPI002FCEC407